MAKVSFPGKPGCGSNTRHKALLAAAGHGVDARKLLTSTRTRTTLLALTRASRFFASRPSH